MTTFGITDAGFVLKRYEDCKAELEDEIREVFGDDVNLDAGSLFGQLINIHATREADTWERMQAAYDATRPAAATGIPLDDILSLSGLTRLPETASSVYVCMRGDDGATIPADFSVSDLDETVHWLLDEETEISVNDAVEAQIHIDSAAAGTYSVIIDGTTHSFVATTETEDEILAALAAVIATALGDAMTVTTYPDTDILMLRAADLSTSFTVSLSGNLSFESIGTLGLFYCEETGAIPAPANSLVKINTPDAVDSVVNFLPATRGRLEETDVECRLRRALSYAGINGATPNAIETRIKTDVNGVSDCYVFINDTDTTDDDGRPPHSVEIVVSGGTDEDIAQKIYEVVAAGVATYGTEAETVTTSLGQTKEINFSRPDLVYVWIRYTLTYDPEMAFPVDGEDQIRSQTVAYGETNFPLGRDLAVDKFKVPVHAVPGVRTVAVELAITDTPLGTPSYDSIDIVLSATQLADFDATRISFLGA